MSLSAKAVALDVGVADPVGTQLEQLSSVLRASLLIEDNAGRVVSHALVDAHPACVLNAVVMRKASPLYEARGRVRVGVWRGRETVVHTTLDGWPGQVTIVPLAGHGWLWLLTSGPATRVPFDELVRPLILAMSSTGHAATDPALFDLLFEEHAVAPVEADAHVVVIRNIGSLVAPVRLAESLRGRIWMQHRLQLTATAEHIYLVLRSVLPVAELASQITDVLVDARERTGLFLAGCIAPPGIPLARGRRLAEQGLLARTEPGLCLTLADCRPHAVLRELLETLRPFTTTLGDPLVDLALADLSVAASLRAWIDHLGDVPAAAASLAVHPNTFRYRLNRAKALVTSDLADPIARLEVQLRLYQMLDGEPLQRAEIPTIGRCDPAACSSAPPRKLRGMK